MKRCLATCLYLFLATFAGAEDLREEATAEALRNAMIGDHQRVTSIAEATRDTINDKNFHFELVALSQAVQKDTLTRNEWKSAMKGAPLTLSFQAKEKVLQLNNPWERFLEARRDRKYVAVRSFYNGIVLPFAYLSQGQFFAMLTVPFKTFEDLAVTRRYLSPEQRKEYFEATQAFRFHDNKKMVALKAQQILEDFPDRRKSLAVLQSKENLRLSIRNEEYVRSEFWIDRYTELHGSLPGTMDAYQEYMQYIDDSTLRYEASVSLQPAASSDREFGAESRFVRALLLGENTETLRDSMMEFQATNPLSSLNDELDAAEVYTAWHNGDKTLAVILANQYEQEDSGWSDRLAAWTKRASVDPEPQFLDAKEALANSRRDFIFKARLPRPKGKSFSSEDARINRLSGFQRARAFFITDTLARALFLPLLPPFPRPDFIEAYAASPEEFFFTKSGEDWLGDVANAYRIEKRYNDSARVYEKLGNDKRSSKMKRREAKRLVSQARTSLPLEAVDLYTRVLNAYADHVNTEKIKSELDEARFNSRVIARIDRRVLRSWRGNLIEMEFDTLLPYIDKKNSNGELTRDGLALLDDGSVSYQLYKKEGRVEIQPSSSVYRRLLGAAEMNGLMIVRSDLLGQPPGRKRIPLALEIGAFPGFDAAPTLVPLERNPTDGDFYR